METARTGSEDIAEILIKNGAQMDMVMEVMHTYRYTMDTPWIYHGYMRGRLVIWCYDYDSATIRFIYVGGKKTDW